LASRAAASGCERGELPLVLVVDDDPNAARLVAAALLGEPCRVEQVCGYAAARQRLASERPAVLVVEIDLPDGSGWDLIAALRQEGAGPAPPVVVFTASARPGAPEAHGLGVHWLPKPFRLRQARALLLPLLRAAAGPGERAER
jgi:two-component system response regulator HydG